VLPRSVNWMRSACLNPLATWLPAPLVESARALVLARSVNWTRLGCLNPLATWLPAPLVESARAVLAGCVNWIRSECLNYRAGPLLVRLVDSAGALHLVLSRSVDWTRRSERLNLLRCCRATLSAYRCRVDDVNG
jgi:hypothetical protein